MNERKHITLRVDDDVYSFLKKNSGKNFSRYVEDLIVRGMMNEIGELYDDALKIKQDSENFLFELVMEKIKKELSSQELLLINFCLFLGVDKSYIRDESDRVANENDYAARLRFYNKLSIQLARQQNIESVKIKEWLGMEN